jgi:hypothetical protein
MLKPKTSYRFGWQLRILWRYLRSGAIGWATQRTLAYVESRAYHLVVGRRHRLDDDWDVLIICDALRADHAHLLGVTTATETVRPTPGLWSLPFLKQTFEDGRWDDTVYVGANGYIGYIDHSRLHAVVVPDATTAIEAIHPQTVTDAAVETLQTYPDKRCVIHFMQPHVPMFTPDGPITDVWEQVRGGEVDDETLRGWYAENVRFVAPYVQEVTAAADGKVVITADHGENLGERRWGIKRYGHSHLTPECRLVPWLELPVTERREVSHGPPQEATQLDAAALEDRLAALGYR